MGFLSKSNIMNEMVKCFFVDMAVEYINENYMENLTLTTVVDQVALLLPICLIINITTGRNSNRMGKLFCKRISITIPC